MPVAPTATAGRVVARPVAPVAALLLGYPLWWLLGVHFVMWALVGAFAVVWSVRNRDRLGVPPGFGWFGVFLGWVLITAFTLTGAKYALSYSFRTVVYTSVVAIGFLLFNLVHQRVVRPEELQRWLLWIWGFAVVLALPGLLTGMTLEVLSPFGLVLAKAGIQNTFIEALTTVSFSSLDSLYGVPRPSPLFEYTNAWGAAMGVLTPVAVHAFVTARNPRDRWVIGSVLAISVWPIVVSVNRGCWLSIALALAYVVGRRTLVGNLRAAGLALLGLVGVALVVVLTPLEGIIAERLATANTDTRSNLYAAALQLAAHSPFFGYGAPQSSALVADNNDVSIGTHGQFWTILVSHGYVGVTLFILGIVTIWWVFRPASGRGPDVWLHATGPVILFQLFVYDVVPVPLLVFFCCHAAIAEHRRTTPARPTPVSTGKEGSPRVSLA